MKKFLNEIKLTYEKNSGKTFNFDIFGSFLSHVIKKFLEK